MKQVYYTLLLGLVCSVLFVTSQTQDCPYQLCNCYAVDIQCVFLNLTRVPTPTGNIPPGYSTFILSFNSISTIQNGRLPPNMTEIDLWGNPVSVVDDHAFIDSADTLNSLSFSGAQLKSIPDAFLDLKNLTSFTIYDTPVQEWKEAVMGNVCQELQSLVLINVSMTVWPGWLRHCSQLKDLALSNNFLSWIPDDGLVNQSSSLTSLVIMNNSLTVVPKALQTLTNLQSLQLQQNRITDVSGLPTSSPLVNLFLSNNLISDSDHLSQAVQPYANTLTLLDLPGNRLTSFPDLISLINVGTFDVSFNRISNPLSGSVPNNTYSISFHNNFLPIIPDILSLLPRVIFLDVPWNSIRQVLGGQIPAWIAVAQLNHNLITELTDLSFPENSQLETIDLSNNPLRIVSSRAFHNTGKLYDLNLGSTNLARVPVAVNSLPSVATLDVSNNAFLVCSCQEKELTSWMRTQSQDNVHGWCGLTSVYEFFTRFSQDCPS